MASPDQPTAPYLDAVVAYGFRGATRFHVPGHKAGNGADLGVRTAIGWQTHRLDIPQDIHGVDLGPSPTPYERAEQLAAEAYGAAPLVVPDQRRDAGQPRALPRARAARRAGRGAAQRARVGDRRPGALRRPADVGRAASTSPCSAWPTASRRSRSKARSRPRPGARAAFIVSPTYYGMAADVAGCAEVAHAAGVPLVVDQSWGPHFGFHEDLPPSALTLGADAMLTLGAQDRRLADAVRAAARRPTPAAIDPDAVAAHAAADALHVALLAADALARRRAPPARAARRGAAVRHDRRLAPHRRGDRRDPRLPRRRRRGDRPARRGRRATRCGS